MAICKRVLIVSDNFVGGGLENRILGQLDCYSSEKIKAYLACGVFNNEFLSYFEKVLKCDSSGWYGAPIGRILKQAQEIYDFCVENRIGRIECHPWNLAFPAALAANRLRIPISLTLHGKTSVVKYDNFFLDTMQRHGFDEINIVGEHIRDEAEECFVNNTINVLPNSIKIETHQVAARARLGYWACISRLDKIKAGLIMEALKIMDAAGVISVIEIFGGGDGEPWLLEEAKKLKKIKVLLRGWTSDAVETLKEGGYCCFLGMGLSAMEAASLDIPVMILGYDGPYLEALSRESFEKIKNNNFTGFGLRPKKQVLRELKDLGDNKPNYKVGSLVKEKCSREVVWGSYLSRINSLEWKKKPALDYLESFAKRAENKNCDIFDRGQQFAFCEGGSRGHYFDEGDLTFFIQSMSKWYRELYEENTNKDRRIKKLESDIANMHESTSWKITKPLRDIKLLIKKR